MNQKKSFYLPNTKKKYREWPKNVEGWRERERERESIYLLNIHIKLIKLIEIEHEKILEEKNNNNNIENGAATEKLRK